ncbi:MAG TPA: glycosyltransferase family A protein, partial [Gammaproteobacteria bacterium]|nr:glycosyltransferase family A protein [Gammaproteobacteria bacterium]
MSPTVSCVVPAYNAERYVARALESVLEQSRPPDEIIVVDDGSTDGTAAVLESYGSRLRVVHQENSGPAAARNRGIRMATGEIICFQDADDEWHRDKLAKQLVLLEARPEVGICITRLRNVWAEHLDEERRGLGAHVFANDPPGYVFQTSLIRRDVFARAGMLDEKLRRAEDIEWFARARDAGIELALISEVLV